MAILRYLAQTADGYEEREAEVPGPFYHGSQCRRLAPGAMLTTGRRTNSWGDEGEKSTHVHIATGPSTAAHYALLAGGHVYEVEPTGELKPGYTAVSTGPSTRCA